MDVMHVLCIVENNDVGARLARYKASNRDEKKKKKYDFRRIVLWMSKRLSGAVEFFRFPHRETLFFTKKFYT